MIWTPQGYYAASPDGDRFIGWHISRGVDKDAEYVGAAQFKKRYYRPDIVARAIDWASAERA